ncbi:MAG: hypothetical protein ACO1QB_12565 [Verrucomicrobiales bacterium]
MKLNFPFLSGALLLVLTLFYAPRQAESCGPEFPNHILGTGKWRSAPAAYFERELINLRLLPEPSENEESIPMEAHGKSKDLQDVEEALQKVGGPHDTLLRAYQVVRKEIDKMDERAWGEEPQTVEEMEQLVLDLQREVEDLSQLGLPAEFALYLKGAIYWKGGDTEDALKQWQGVLDLLPSERKFRSTWAAFMLGRAYRDSAPDTAWKHFETTQRMAAAGFIDSTGLANAADGWLAYIALKRNDFGKALDHYLKQKGDGNSIESLRITAARAMDTASIKELQRLAADPKWRGVVTAFLVSSGPKFLPDTDEGASDRLKRWLAAMEAAEVKDDQLSQKFALAAYQAGDMEQARKWADLSVSSPVSQWIHAKLALYDGEVEEAARILATLSRTFPVQAEGLGPRGNFVAGLSIHSDNGWETFSGAEQVWAERGAVELSRQNFVEALDAFMQAAFWLDAAYVAERVLTLDELKEYVDQNSQRLEQGQNRPIKPLKNLLARRLMREGKAVAARNYFSEELQESHGKLVASLKEGYNPARTREERAKELFNAAKLTRESGMELMGTELGPDWAESGGSYEWGDFLEIRNAGEDQFLKASPAELARVSATELPFSRRFHYRYVAAELAWIAAGFMPDNHDETARMLCLGGRWLKYRDPEYADRFYKSLVKRCRKTELGALADVIRWFPKVDAEGIMIKAINLEQTEQTSDVSQFQEHPEQSEEASSIIIE